MTLTLNDIPIELDSALRRRAERLHLSVDQVVVDALKTALGPELVQPTTSGPKNLAEAISARFAPLGGIELPERIQDPIRDPVDFGQ